MQPLATVFDDGRGSGSEVRPRRQRHQPPHELQRAHHQAARHRLVTCRKAKARIDTLYRNLYYPCMKTTLNINDQLLANAKVLAVQQRTSLTRLIEEGLQLRLRSAAKPSRAPKLRVPVLKGRGGLVAGVNPLSNKALLAALDDDA